MGFFDKEFGDPKPEDRGDWASLFGSGASGRAPAELPSTQRVAMAQMASQFQEWQSLGFTRAEAFSLVQAQVVAAVQILGQQRRRGEDG